MLNQIKWWPCLCDLWFSDTWWSLKKTVMHFVQQKTGSEITSTERANHLTWQESEITWVFPQTFEARRRCAMPYLNASQIGTKLRKTYIWLKNKKGASGVVIILVGLSEASQKKTWVLRSASLHSFLCSSSSSSSSWINSFAELSFWRFLRQWRLC